MGSSSLQFKNKKTLQNEVDDNTAGVGDDIGWRRRKYATASATAVAIALAVAYLAFIITSCLAFSIQTFIAQK